MRSGNESNANKAYIFSSVGSLDGDSTDRRHAVRPALYSTVINWKSREYPVLLGLSLAYDAWLRSGIYGSASYVYLLYSSGALNNALANTRYAVRPALHLFAENLLQTIPEFGSFKNDRTD